MFRKCARRRRTNQSWLFSPLVLERLEDRTVPSTFTVTSLSDSGAGSLRAALASANAQPDADIILFAPNLANKTVGLTSVDPNDAVGPSALVVSTPVTIAGTGQTITRTGSADFRLFYVTTAGNLTLENLTLTNGLAQGGNGGNGGTSETSSEAGGGGGGAGLGGATYNQGVLTLDGCTLTGNQAIGGNGGTAGDTTTGAGGGGMGGNADATGDGGGPNGGAVGDFEAVSGGNGGFGGGGDRVFHRAFPLPVAPAVMGDSAAAVVAAAMIMSGTPPEALAAAAALAPGAGSGGFPSDWQFCTRGLNRPLWPGRRRQRRWRRWRRPGWGHL